MKDSLVAAAVRGVGFATTSGTAKLVVLEDDRYYNYDYDCTPRAGHLLGLFDAHIYISETGYVTLLTRDEDAAREFRMLAELAR